MYNDYSMNYPKMNYQPMDYRNFNSNYSMDYRNYNSEYPMDDERFFWAPFVVGGLAGTALGFGIANNNQLNNGSMQPVYPVYPYPMYQPYPSYPTISSSNNYYY